MGKKSGGRVAAAQREEGLEKTDNGLGLTSWPVTSMINQKNYYTEYLKREEQYLTFRTGQEELANPTSSGLGIGSTVVIHPGSRNLRIGFATDAWPKTVPMVIARRISDDCKVNTSDIIPLRKPNSADDTDGCEKQFGDAFLQEYGKMSADLKTHMRLNKRRIMPNSLELVVNYNKKTTWEDISEHNDPHRTDWTDVSAAPGCVFGDAALRIPEGSKPRYKLFWPIRGGSLNEQDYTGKHHVWNDFFAVIEDALKSQLGMLNRREWSSYSCCFIVPDLYEREYVTGVLDGLMREFGFRRVCFMQESVAATFGAGYTVSCIVDVGAQKTSICCVEDGLCVEDSRITLKFGGDDVTEIFIKFLLCNYFPYQEINLAHRHDYELAEELKKNFCTMNEANISVQLATFHLRRAGRDTRKVSFKMYDETMLAPLAYFYPEMFDNSLKLKGRRTLLDRSYDIYDGTPNDPVSLAQTGALEYACQNFAHLPGVVTTPEAAGRFIELNRIARNGPTSSNSKVSAALSNGYEVHPPGNVDLANLTTMDKTVVASEERDANPPVNTSNEASTGTSQPLTAISASVHGLSNNNNNNTRLTRQNYKFQISYAKDDILALMPLDEAILYSIRVATNAAAIRSGYIPGPGSTTHEAAGQPTSQDHLLNLITAATVSVDARKTRDLLLGGIMLVGGGAARIPGCDSWLEGRLRLALQREAQQSHAQQKSRTSDHPPHHHTPPDTATTPHTSRGQVSLATPATAKEASSAGSGSGSGTSLNSDTPTASQPPPPVVPKSANLPSLIINTPPRDLDAQFVVWKGGSVYARLTGAGAGAGDAAGLTTQRSSTANTSVATNVGNDGWLYAREYELLGHKILGQKVLWNW